MLKCKTKSVNAHLLTLSVHEAVDVAAGSARGHGAAALSVSQLERVQKLVHRLMKEPT